MNNIVEWAKQWVHDCGPYKAGFLTAVALIVLLFLLWQILRLFSRKRVREIIIPASGGSLVVSAGAVSNLVQAVIDNRFRCIKVKKIILWKNGRGTTLEISGSFDVDGGKLPDVASELKDAVLKSLDGQLGITSIREIVPNIREITVQHGKA